MQHTFVVPAFARKSRTRGDGGAGRNASVKLARQPGKALGHHHQDKRHDHDQPEAAAVMPSGCS
jgi:hypothetical protein